MNIYEEWGLKPIINASGAVTRLGGAPMPPAVLRAYHEAAAHCVPLEMLQARASSYLAEVTGAEAGLVTSGAAAALMLGAAAILTRHCPARMEQLPHTHAMPHEFVIAREQRNAYDHAVRAAGAKLVEVGFHEPIAGSGVRRCEAWEYEAAFGPNTVGVLYVVTPDSQPPLREVVAVAHRRGLPVLVDAAGALPPRRNLRELVGTGADLVCFSGGKALRGPQGTGLLIGAREFIGPAAVQMLDLDDHPTLWDPDTQFIDRVKLRGMPRQGIGRGGKVSKEQILSLLTAIRLFVAGTYDDELSGMHARLTRIASGLEGSRVRTHLIPSDGESYPLLEIALDRQSGGRSAFEVARQLRCGDPPVFVGHGFLADGKLVIHPLHLGEADTDRLLAALRTAIESPKP